MFNEKKLIIFDLDGTLIDSIGMWNKTDEILLDKIDKDHNLKDKDIIKIRNEILTKYNDKNVYLKWCEYLKNMCKSNFSVEEIDKLRWDISRKFAINDISYKEKAADLLYILKNDKFILALATTTNKEFLEIYKNLNKNIKEKADFNKIFDYIITKDDVKFQKPNPESHNIIIKKYNVLPNECLLFEDSLIGVTAGKNAGIDTVAMYDKYSDTDRIEINKISTYQFDNYNEVIKLYNKQKRLIKR